MADNPLNGLSSNKDIAGVTGTNTAEPRVASVSLGGRMDPSAPASSGPVLYPTGSMGLMATAIPHPPLPSELVYGNSVTNNGVHGDSANSDAVVGVAHAAGKAGVLGISDNGNGVSGISKNGTGVFGSGGQRAGFFQGNVEVTGDIQLTGADCAEQFDVAFSDNVEPGTVMVIDTDDTLRVSQSAYDRRVAGVVSGAGELKPGIVLDKRQSGTKRLPIAMVGKVYCRVDAQYSPVEIGDLLTTSATPGHAMKAINPVHSFGAVLGKALRALPSGTGLIPVLVALQ